MLIGISIYPIVPVGNAAMCIVFFNTEHDSSKIFVQNSTKAKSRSYLTENEFELFQQKVIHNSEY